MDAEISAVHQSLVSLVQESVQVADAREGHLVDDQFWLVGLEAVERCTAVGVHDESAVVELLHMVVKPRLCFAQTQFFGGVKYGLEVTVDSKVLLKFGAGLNTLLRVVLWYELLFETK